MKEDKSTENIEGYMNAEEATKFLSISRTYLHNLMKAKKIPFYKIGKSLRFSKKELVDYLEKHYKVQ